MQLRSPIQRNYFNNRKYCLVNQWFGENKNALFYGPLGHNGVDFKTQGPFKYLFNKLTGFLRSDKDSNEQKGLIPIVAAHDGYVTSPENADKDRGIYVRITDASEPTYETLYFHLDKIRVYRDDKYGGGWSDLKGGDFIKAGTVIGWGGNTGKYTTGAHLHFGLYKNKVAIDPMPFFQDNVVYTKVFMSKNQYIYQGKSISKEEVNNLNFNA